MPKFTTPRGDGVFKLDSILSQKIAPEIKSKKVEMDGTNKFPRERELSRVFSEDYEVVDKLILDPRGTIVSRWNKVFLVACLVSLFVDPLFFYLPGARDNMCLQMCFNLEVAITIIRSIVDAFYIVRIFVRFRTAYVAPSSRVFGRGELVIEPSKISSRYLHKDFWLDLVAALPLPQVMSHYSL